MYRTAIHLLILSLACSSLAAWPQSSNQQPPKNLLSVRPSDRVIQPIDENQRVALAGQLHPLARPRYSVGELPSDQRMDRMVLVLRPDPEQESALEALIEAQQEPDSPYYHQWLTPQTFEEKFGVSVDDLQQIVTWLEIHGMEIDEIPSSHRSIVFSGMVSQVESAFHTSIQRYLVGGQMHFANATEPEIPQALSEVVRGVLSLHDFLSVPDHVVTPAFTAGSAHYLMPLDWDTIYDVSPLYNQGIDGTGQSIAVLGRVDITLSDVRTFRTNAGLPANDPQIIVNGTDPGDSSSDDAVESALDVEWAGAIAKNATIKFVTSKSGTSDGIALSAQYAVTHNVAPIVSLSYGLCEADEGSGGNAFWNSLWQQAASQGMSVLVSSGDSGAAGCDSSGAQTASQGRGVNGLCSSPYSSCVGGTSFNEGSNSGQYWSATNGSGLSSALSYIPETAWNESGQGSGLWSTGGGVSTVYSKPSWQSATGVPADGKRDVPDVAMTAAMHDAYLIQFQGSTYAVGGTSAATPSLASALALVLEKAGAAQGNLNPTFYALAASQYSGGGAAVFHDVTSGNNSVPGVTGFNAGTGYDPATGLGSIDANLLVNHWSGGSADFALTPAASSVTVAKGSSNAVTLALTPSNGFDSKVMLSASGTPSGVTVKFSSTTLTSTPVTVTIAATTSASAGNSTLTITGKNGSLTRTVQLALTVVMPTFTLTPSATRATIEPNSSASITVTTAAVNGFHSAIAFSVSGLPKGVAAKFVPSSIASPGNGSSTLTLSVASTAVTSSATVTLKASGGGITQTQAFSLSAIVPTFTLTANALSANLITGGNTSFVLATVGENFNSAISLAAIGLPRGVAANSVPATIAAPGTGSSIMTLSAGVGTLAGTFHPKVSATGGGVTKTVSLTLTIPPPSFNMSTSGAAANVAIGGTTSVSVSTSLLNGFQATVALSVTGLPRGVTAAFSPASIVSPGGGSSTLTLTAASNAVAGSYKLTLKASGGSVSKTQTLSLTVTH